MHNVFCCCVKGSLGHTHRLFIFSSPHFGCLFLFLLARVCVTLIMNVITVCASITSECCSFLKFIVHLISPFYFFLAISNHFSFNHFFLFCILLRQDDNSSQSKKKGRSKEGNVICFSISLSQKRRQISRQNAKKKQKTKQKTRCYLSTHRKLKKEDSHICISFLFLVYFILFLLISFFC